MKKKMTDSVELARATGGFNPPNEVCYVIQLPRNYPDFASEFFLGFYDEEEGGPLPLWTSKAKYVKRGTLGEMTPIYWYIRLKSYPVKLFKLTGSKKKRIQPWL
jgi:hypothetical protein